MTSRRDETRGDRERHLAAVESPETDGVVATSEVATASALVEACEAAWAAIQAEHPELPDAVVVLGSGVERGRLVKLGHWWSGRWLADGAVRGEVLLAGEALHLGAADVFEVLLHEAAHGINAARGVKDTSRGGRYHNMRFAAVAREVGLDVKASPPYGLARTVLTEETKGRYGGVIERLGEAMRIARQLDRSVEVGEGTGEGGDGRGGRQGKERRSGTSVVALCGCGRRLRMAPSVLAAGPVLCGLCGAEFTRAVQVERPYGARAVVDRSFLARRRAALEVERGPAADEKLARAVAEQSARLRAALRHAADEMEMPRHVLEPLLHRSDRLGALAREVVASHSPEIREAAPEQREGLAELAEHASDPDRGLAAAWYERFGTMTEQPMHAATTDDAERRVRLARALLKSDGTLRGPAVSIAGREYMEGDRVVASEDDVANGVPPGALGTVESVEPSTGSMNVDFATLGRLRVSLETRLAQVLRHDYVEPVRQLETEVGREAVELELQRSLLESGP